MERKSAEQDTASETDQKHQKTLPKTEKSENGGELPTQISDFSPLSQTETSSSEHIPAPTTTVYETESGESPSRPPRLPAHNRIVLRLAAMLVALVPLALLITAGLLSPAQQGLGTHQQLGLPPCSLRVLAGIRCPACGMTTSWSYFARGNWLASINTNAGGFLLALLCIAIIVLAAQVARRGHLPSPRIQNGVTIAAVGVFIVTLLDWIARLQN